ncbi:sensor histidine kinase [Bogoriella caseilytica]|nr:ATP-binding protein [Bogoriella caseilytica]
MPFRRSAALRRRARRSRFSGSAQGMPQGPVTIFGHHLPFGAVIFAVLLGTLFADLSMLGNRYFFAAMVLAVMTTGLSAILPWGRLPSWCPALLALSDMAVVALLEIAGNSFAVLLVLPALWLSMTYGAAGAILATGVGALAAWGPELINWTAPATPASFEVRHLLIPLVLAATSLYTWYLERRSHARSALLARQSSLVQEALEAIDDRETLLRGILNTIDVGVIALNAEGRVTHMNRRMNEILGGSVRQGDYAEKLEDPGSGHARRSHHLAPSCPVVRVSRGEEIHRELAEVEGAGPTPRIMRVSGTQIYDEGGERSGAVVAYQDVTTENNALAQREEFVSAVSHELRTPLTSILGYLELASTDPSVPNLPRSYLAVASRNADRLERLINDLLTAGSGELEVTRTAIDLREVTTEAVATHQLRAKERGITVDFDAPEPCIVRGDRIRLAQVCDNLLSNAVKYSRDGGRVEVTLESTHGHAVLTVADDGIGIAAEEQGQIFDRFYRTSAARQSSVPGTGLGLHISRRLVQAQHGTLTFRSSEDSGSTFIVTLPQEVS